MHVCAPPSCNSSRGHCPRSAARMRIRKRVQRLQRSFRALQIRLADVARQAEMDAVHEAPKRCMELVGDLLIDAGNTEQLEHLIADERAEVLPTLLGDELAQCRPEL